MDSPQEVTRLLERWGAGEAGALDKLLPFVYGELRRLALQLMRGQPAGHTLQPTALIHEVYLKLADRNGNLSFENRGGLPRPRRQGDAPGAGRSRAGPRRRQAGRRGRAG